MIFHQKLNLKKAFIAAFFIVLILPVIQTSTHVFKITPVDENRTMERAPALQEYSHPSLYLAQAQKWFDDHYGFRDILIRIETQIDYSIFGMSNKIHIGKDGWLYYKTFMDGEKPIEESLTDNQIQTIVNHFAQLRDHLAASNVKLVIISNQLKHKFYPEDLPEFLMPAEKHLRFDDLREKLHKLPGVIYIDTTDILMSLKEQRQIFHKTDMHWNDPAAYEIAKIVVNKLADLEGFKKPLWDYPLKIMTKKFSGGQATAMPLFIPASEEGLFLQEMYPAIESTHVENQYPYRTIIHVTAHDHALLPTVVWYGDSFSDGMERAGLDNYFTWSYRASRSTVEASEVLAHMPPDAHYFVFQFIEASLAGFVNANW